MNSSLSINSKEITLRRCLQATGKFVLLLAFYVAGYLSAANTTLDQVEEIKTLKAELAEQHNELVHFEESNKLVQDLAQQVKELTEVIDRLQAFHTEETK